METPNRTSAEVPATLQLTPTGLEIAFSHQAGGAQAHDQRIRESGFSLTARKTGKWLCDKALGFERRPTKPHRLQSIPEYERSEYKVTL
jgi:hypothetical protein